MSTSEIVSDRTDVGDDLPPNDDGGDADIPSIEESTDDSGGLSFGLSKRQIALALGVVVVISLVLWRLRQSPNSGESKAAQEVEKARTEEIAGDLELKDTDGDGDADIAVPNDPDDELDKDAAVLEGLKESGKMKGGE